MGQPLCPVLEAEKPRMLLDVAKPRRFPLQRGETTSPGKGTLRCGPPKGAPGCPGCRVWCPRRASSEPRFWGLLCRAAGLVLSCVRAPPCPCSGEYQKCVRCPGAPRATRRAAVSPPAHPPRSSNPSTRHLQVGLAAGAARGSQTEPKQKEGVEMPLCKLGCKRG